MAELFNALTVAEARSIIARCLPPPKPGKKIPLLDSLGRVLAAEVRADGDVPGFDRSTVDGYAVRAKDTYEASESMPAHAVIGGEVLMGHAPQGSVGARQAWHIPTGGMLPAGADAVVMVEHTKELGKELGQESILITRPVVPGENVVRRGEDIAAGELALPAGHRIRSQDLGILSSMGVTQVDVIRPYRVGIASTGDELVVPATCPAPGQVRDVNSYTLCGAVSACGGEPRFYGIVRDNFAALKSALARIIAENDLALLSGGSSVGKRDAASEVIDSLGKPGVLFHGISIKPGKPTIGAIVEGKPVFGLPGHPASALVVFDLLVAPLIRAGSYQVCEIDVLTEFPLQAEIVCNLHSTAGREDFIRVRLFLRNGRLMAEPVRGKTGLISTLVKADGLVYIPAEKEGVEAGELVRVKLF